MKRSSPGQKEIRFFPSSSVIFLISQRHRQRCYRSRDKLVLASPVLILIWKFWDFLFVYSLFNLKKISLSSFKWVSICSKFHTVLVWSCMLFCIASSSHPHFFFLGYLSHGWVFLLLFNSAELFEVPSKTWHQDKLWASEVTLLAVPKTLSWFQEAKVKRVWSELGRIHLNWGKRLMEKNLVTTSYLQCPRVSVLFILGAQSIAIVGRERGAALYFLLKTLVLMIRMFCAFRLGVVPPVSSDAGDGWRSSTSHRNAGSEGFAWGTSEPCGDAASGHSSPPFALT